MNRESLLKQESERILQELVENEHDFNPYEVIQILQGADLVVRKARAKIINKRISAPVREVLKEAENLAEPY